MIRALNKKRSANFYANQVKFLLFIVIAVLFWNSNGARQFTADMLYNASAIVQPNNNWVMQFLVKDITFDFTTDDDSLDYIKTEQQGYEHILAVTGEHPLGIWEADDEDDLVEEITCATGYCISAINFEHVLTNYSM